MENQSFIRFKQKLSVFDNPENLSVSEKIEAVREIFLFLNINEVDWLCNEKFIKFKNTIVGCKLDEFESHPFVKIQMKLLKKKWFKCRAVTLKGRQCRHKMKEGHIFCSMHKKYYLHKIFDSLDNHFPHEISKLVYNKTFGKFIGSRMKY